MQSPGRRFHFISNTFTSKGPPHDPPYRIFVADDHPLILEVVEDFLGREPDLELVGSANNGDDALWHVERLKPDLLILDLRMSGLPALSVVAAVRAQPPKTRILVMSAYGGPAFVRRLRDLGIEGYILKDEAPEMLLAAVRSIPQGATWFSQEIFDVMVNLSQNGDPPSDTCSMLTAREREILNLIGEGMSNHQIAVRLDLSPQTVRNNTSRIYDKIGVHSRAEAIVWFKTHAPGP